ncbi:MAG TPA: response regulator transcription factor [Actinophytocola sp.]|uniref:response regulator transcription factor n=1 Tax=Actinophytocola sp. TaxID=1872138 RepID=UPI002DDCFD61|nr:response regulator transcription factor [Actinophytocola sp.]HEV2784337.1 response regulator transcription factor [Actinophytocola sp.]
MTVALVDDHPVMRAGLRALLSRVDGISVVAEASTEPGSLAEALLNEPDVLIVDGPVAEVVRSAPGAAVLVFTTSEDDESVFNAMRAGARGYLLKGAARDDLIRAIRGVAAGEVIFGARIAHRLTGLMTRRVTPFPTLTTREREILELIARGLDNIAIARALFLAPKTVRNNICAIFAKLGVVDRAEAIARARAAGIS